MPTKILDSQTDNKGLQNLFKFGGGANTIVAIDDGVSGYGYIIRSGSGDDMIFGSDFTERVGTGTPQDERTLEGDLLIGGDGDDMIIGGAGNDTIFAGNEDGTDGAKGKDAVASNAIYGDGERQADGSLTADVSFSQSSTFTGGNDTLHGSEGYTIMRGDADIVTFSGDTFTGGNDTMIAGSGGSNMTGDARIISGTGTITGGADTLVSGAGNDQMFGDWSNADGFSGTMTGGADTFVFLSVDHGFDAIGDFQLGVDKIDLSETGLSWALLDTDSSGFLDAGDVGVTINGGNTQLNLADAASGTTGSFGSLLTISDVTGLAESDFVFV